MPNLSTKELEDLVTVFEQKQYDDVGSKAVVSKLIPKKDHIVYNLVVVNQKAKHAENFEGLTVTYGELGLDKPKLW